MQYSFVFQLILDRLQTKKLTDIAQREQLLIEALREYEHRLSRTGFENDISVRQTDIFHERDNRSSCGSLQDDFETMKLKQKEMLIEKKHQELDIKEEMSIKELDQLSQTERSLCESLTAVPMEIIPGSNNDHSY
jgi:hypothetical protein